MIYGQPVKVLQQMLTPSEFAELMVYDEVWGLDRHREIIEEVEPTQDMEVAARARFAKPADGKPKPGSLNRRTAKRGK